MSSGILTNGAGSHPGLGLVRVEASFRPQLKEDVVENAEALWKAYYPCLDGELSTLEEVQNMYTETTKVDQDTYQRRAFETLHDIVQTPFVYGAWDIIFKLLRDIKSSLDRDGFAPNLTRDEIWRLAGMEVELDPVWMDKAASTGIHMQARMYRIALRQLGSRFAHYHGIMVRTEYQPLDKVEMPPMVQLNRQANDASAIQCAKRVDTPIPAPVAIEQMTRDRADSPVQDAINRQRPRWRKGSDLVYVTALPVLAALWCSSPVGIVLGTVFAVTSIWRVKQLTQRTCDLAAKAVIMVDTRTTAVVDKALSAVKEVTDKTTTAMREAGDNAAQSLRTAAQELGNKVQAVAADTTESVKRAANVNVLNVVGNQVLGALDWSVLLAAVGILGFVASYVLRKPSRVRNMEAVRKFVRKHDGQESLTSQLTVLLEPVLMDKHEYSTIRNATDFLSTMFLLPLLYLKGPKYAFQMGQTIASTVRLLLGTCQVVTLVRGWFSDEESPVDVVEANIGTIVDRLETMTDPVRAAREEAELNSALVLAPNDEKIKRELVKLKAAKAAPPVQMEKENVFWKWAQENRVLASSFIMGIIALFAGSAYLLYQRRKKTLSTHVFRVAEKTVYVNDKGQALEVPVGKVRIYQKELQESFPLAAYRTSGRYEKNKKFYVSKNKKSGRWVVYDDKGKYVDYIDAFDNTDDELVFQDRDDLLAVDRYMTTNGHALGDNSGYDGEDWADWMRETNNPADDNRVRLMDGGWRAGALESVAPVALPILTPIRQQSVAVPAQLSSLTPKVTLPKALRSLILSHAVSLHTTPQEKTAAPKVELVSTAGSSPLPKPAIGAVSLYRVGNRVAKDCNKGDKCSNKNCFFIHPVQERCIKKMCSCKKPHPFLGKARCDKAGCDQTCGQFHRKDKVAVPRNAKTESLNGIVPVTDSKLAKSLGLLQVQVSDVAKDQGQCFVMANRVWTAKHVVGDGMKKSDVSYRDGIEMPVQPGKWYACDGFDIAYTELTQSNRPSLSVGREPVVGESVQMRVFDYTKREWVTAVGTVKSMDSTFLHYDIPTDTGYSGGAVLDQRGNVIAIHTNGAAVRNGPNKGLRITPTLVAVLTRTKNL
jgi:hypothetical protein